ncbi:hypothetical protein [Bifidobacterium sp. SO1]|uniref:hypothetical protein n=1 Tax=Bifidobacterium sp. SO1 TaxID=2809029 RepID=UPI001BDCFBF0|nr:hypothetical protein [Bifidobacterium sp. SO1]MBT1162548.1 hypothetical protein [Bifidobacterium sp. SO1]
MKHQSFDIAARHVAEDLVDLLIRSDARSEYVLWECDDHVAREDGRQSVRLRRYPSGRSVELVFVRGELNSVRFSAVVEENVSGLPLPMIASLILNDLGIETARK